MRTPFTPRPHQTDALSSSIDWMLSGRMQHIIEMPTGSGKSFLAGWHLTKSLGTRDKALFLVPRIDLAEQTRNAFLEKFFLPHEVGIIQGQQSQIGRKVTIATVQTLQREERLREVLQRQRTPFSSIVVDECHLSPSGYEKIAQQVLAPGGLFLGLSATPYRSDGVSLAQFFPDGLCYSADILDLIAIGSLVDVHSYDIPTSMAEMDIDDEESLDLDDVRFEERMAASNRYQVIYESWMSFARGMRTLFFGHTITDCYSFARFLAARGHECVVITSKTPIDVRNDAYTRFRKGELLFLAGFNVLTTGLDLPEVQCILWGRFTENRGLFTQAIGRGTRTAAWIGKEFLILLNFSKMKHTLMSMGMLIGDPNKEILSVRRSMQEKLEGEEELAELELVQQTPQAQAERLYAHLKTVHAYATSVFTGDGWTRDPVTGNYTKSYGKHGTITAERSFTGYMVTHHSAQEQEQGEGQGKGRSRKITDQPLPPEMAMAKGHQHIERMKQKEALFSGDEQEGSKPITHGQLSYLRDQRRVLILGTTGMTQSHYVELSTLLKQYKSAFPNTAEHPKGSRIGYSPGLGVTIFPPQPQPQQKKEKKEKGKKGA